MVWEGDWEKYWLVVVVITNKVILGKYIKEEKRFRNKILEVIVLKRLLKMEKLIDNCLNGD